MIPRFGRHGPRSKVGCTTCRTRKIKCDERRPLCTRCERAGIKCEWDKPAKPRRRRLLRPAPPEEASLSSSSASTSASDTAAIAASASATDDASLSLPPLAVRSEPEPPSRPGPGPGMDMLMFEPWRDQDQDQDQATATDTAMDTPFPFPDLNPTCTPSARQQQLGLSMLYNASSNLHLLRPALSTTHIPLSNSLMLGAQDRECFQYIPNSFMVQAIGKPWAWSMLSYIHSRIASHEKGVMRAFIALASMELRCRYISATDQGQGRDPDQVQAAARQKKSLATGHYRLALGDLSRLLDRASQPDRTDQDLDALFAMWFLILWFGTYDPELVQASHVHLRGIRSFVSQNLRTTGGGGKPGLPPASQQLLYFISLVDTSLALGNLRGGELTQDLLSLRADSHLHQDRLFQEARTCLPRIWGANYPPEQLLDDLENYRPLSLLQACEKLKIELWSLGITSTNAAVDQRDLDLLWQKIETAGQVFADVITMARIATHSGGRRVMWTVYHSALEYYAVRVLFSCLSSSKKPEHGNSHEPEFPSWLDTTLTDLLGIAYKSLGENPLMVYRFAWPLTVAMLRTRDPIHKDWISSQVRRAHALVGSLGIPTHLLQDMSTSPGALLLDSPPHEQEALDVSLTLSNSNSHSHGI
ncbi:hypothetical protein A1O3_07821 [Capronia epimyces CBS 606.96]|uniref:Zn(2)-C6 fungal-type domain-containing protein n=1 Tax=Capronia epimyces CBS 606.96 TaxID=1182542 RepID=W9XGA7_9EURO|nr:uncharacterized protein A1O3_07821 [Capronia epimyces CBS 606.96]EXJ79542.1 hypothetical protein A1O3_07821 [Capronia epimyces CBS 606.96]